MAESSDALSGWSAADHEPIDDSGPDATSVDFRPRPDDEPGPDLYDLRPDADERTQRAEPQNIDQLGVTRIDPDARQALLPKPRHETDRTAETPEAMLRPLLDEMIKSPPELRLPEESIPDPLPNMPVNLEPKAAQPSAVRTSLGPTVSAPVQAVVLGTPSSPPPNPVPKPRLLSLPPVGPAGTESGPSIRASLPPRRASMPSLPVPSKGEAGAMVSTVGTVAKMIPFVVGAIILFGLLLATAPLFMRSGSRHEVPRVRFVTKASPGFRIPGAQDKQAAEQPWIWIVSAPDDAQVELGGRLVGRTPFAAPSQAGSEAMQVRLTKDGYHPWAGELRRDETGHFRLMVDLEKVSEDETIEAE